MNYYTSRRWLLLTLFDWAVKQARPILVARYGREFTDTVRQEARREFEILIPQLPYIGGIRNPHTQIIVAAALFLALYRVLKARGRSADEVGVLAYQAVEAMYAAYPKFLLRFLGQAQRLMYGGRSARRMAAESQKRRYPADFVCTFVEGNGQEFDDGFDYMECGIVKFFHPQGADEFTPYMCRLDYPYAEAFGIKLLRVGTLAEGAEKCDFRFKR